MLNVEANLASVNLALMRVWPSKSIVPVSQDVMVRSKEVDHGESREPFQVAID